MVVLGIDVQVPRIFSAVSYPCFCQQTPRRRIGVACKLPTGLGQFLDRARACARTSTLSRYFGVYRVGIRAGQLPNIAATLPNLDRSLWHHQVRCAGKLNLFVLALMGH